jgi:hypothetical protein
VARWGDQTEVLFGRVVFSRFLIEQLEGISFAWCKNKEKWEEIIVPALLTYKKVYGDLEVP